MEPITKGPFSPYWVWTGDGYKPKEYKKEYKMEPPDHTCDENLIGTYNEPRRNKMEPCDDLILELGDKVIDSGYKESDIVIRIDKSSLIMVLGIVYFILLLMVL